MRGTRLTDATAGRGLRGRDIACRPLTTGLARTATCLLRRRRDGSAQGPLRGSRPPGSGRTWSSVHHSGRFLKSHRGVTMSKCVCPRRTRFHTQRRLCPGGRQPEHPGSDEQPADRVPARGGGTVPIYVLCPRRRGPALVSTSPDTRAGSVRPGVSPPHVLGPQPTAFAFWRVLFLGVSGET